MFSEFLKWLIKSSDVITNTLDLMAFVLASPEIIGRERIKHAQERVREVEERLLDNTNVFFVFRLSIVIFLLVAVSCAVKITAFIFSVNAFFGVIVAIALVIGFSYLAWDFTMSWLVMKVNTGENIFTPILHWFYAVFEHSSFAWTIVLSPRGMLYTALVLFLLSRVLAVAHALSVA